MPCRTLGVRGGRSIGRPSVLLAWLMSLSQANLPHLAFFAALAGPADTETMAREIRAGLVVLRFADYWVETGAEVAGPLDLGFRAAHDAVVALTNTTYRRALAQLLDVMASAGGRIGHHLAGTQQGRAEIIVAPLLAYARLLRFDARWALALDVYETVLRLPALAPEDEARAWMDVGYCRRMQASWDEAVDAYVHAGHVAGRAGLPGPALTARLAVAIVARDRGNLPAAEQALRALLTDARPAGHPAITAAVLHDLAATVHLRGDPGQAATLAHEALAMVGEGTARDRLLGDLGQFLLAAGDRAAARDAHLVLAATAQELTSRWVSQITLLEIAALDGDRTAFEQQRRQLARAPLPPWLAGELHYYLGVGYHAFGELAEGGRALLRAAELSQAHGLHELSFRVEQALARAARKGRDHAAGADAASAAVWSGDVVTASPVWSGDVVTASPVDPVVPATLRRLRLAAAGMD